MDTPILPPNLNTLIWIPLPIFEVSGGPELASRWGAHLGRPTEMPILYPTSQVIVTTTKVETTDHYHSSTSSSPIYRCTAQKLGNPAISVHGVNVRSRHVQSLTCQLDSWILKEQNYV